nr:unnamed protein product [Callosobruchus chinensis]
MDHRYRHQHRYDTSQCFAMSPPPHQPQHYHYPPQGVHFRNRLYRVTGTLQSLPIAHKRMNFIFQLWEWKEFTWDEVGTVGRILK